MKGVVKPYSPKFVVNLFQHGPTRLNRNLQPFNQGSNMLNIKTFMVDILNQAKLNQAWGWFTTYTMKGVVKPCPPKFVVNLFQHGPTRLNRNLQPFNQGSNMLNIKTFMVDILNQAKLNQAWGWFTTYTMKGVVKPCPPKFVVDLFQHGPTRLNQNLQPFNQGSNMLNIETSMAYNNVLHVCIPPPSYDRCLDTSPQHVFEAFTFGIRNT